MRNAGTLKIRIIPILLLKENRCVKGKQFKDFIDTGNPTTAAKVYDSQKADELIFIDISRDREHRKKLYEIILQTAEECFMPFTVGGGIVDVEEIRKFLELGADKVSINTAAVENPNLIKEGAERFGSQCVVVAIDVKKTESGKYEVYTRNGIKPTGLDPVDWAKEAKALGAGEILLTSIDKEGMRTGYDLELTAKVADALNIPVIANGGVGTTQDLAEGIKLGHASAVAASSIYHFTDQSTIKARGHMKEAGLNVRPQW